MRNYFAFRGASAQREHYLARSSSHAERRGILSDVLGSAALRERHRRATLRLIARDWTLIRHSYDLIRRIGSLDSFLDRRLVDQV
jgi:hypothetical protein